jgi:hypothetical protein
VSFQEQITELLFEVVNRFQRRTLAKVNGQPLLLFRLVMPMPAHQRQQTAMLRVHRARFFPAGQEVMMDDTDNVETVGHNAPGESACAPASGIPQPHPSP